MRIVLNGFCALLMASSSALAIDSAAVERELKTPLLDKASLQRDMEQYCQSRVPLVPEPRDRASWDAFIQKARKDTLDNVIFRGEAAAWRAIPTKAEWLGEVDAGDYRLRRLRFEVIPGMWTCGVLYEPKKLTGKVPVVLNVNGHDKDGKAAKYKQIRCINQVKRGMLALNLEWFNMGQLRTAEFDHYRLNQLDLCGTSGVACFYLSMSRALDILIAHEHADSSRVAVTGLSGGGWQTIFISGLDERVTLCDPVAGYSSFRTRAVVRADLGDSEQTPSDLATTADYALLTAMRAPRPTLLTFNDRDNCCFQAGNALPELLNAARPAFRLYNAADNLAVHVNHDPGTHNFDQDNREALYRMFGRHFFGGLPFDAAEIPCEAEVRTAEQLAIELPKDNAGFTTVAQKLAEKLPRPATGDAETRRSMLRNLLRFKPLTAKAKLLEMNTIDNIGCRRWALRINDEWTLPAAEFVPPEWTEATVIIADEGRASTAALVAKLVGEKKRVLVFDPLHLGESKLPSHDFLFGLLIAAVGDRPLGVQAGQIGAVADWWKSECRRPVELRTIGRRSSLMGLCAAALHAQSIARINTDGGFKTLKEILSEGLAIPNGVELFCFGLLEQFDIPELQTLTERRG